MMTSVSIGMAAAMLGVSVATLRRWENAGRFVPKFRTPGGHRRYDTAAVVAFGGDAVAVEVEAPTVCYARVSSHDQKEDLVRQEERLRRHCAEQGWTNVEVIADLGSGLNYAKRGLRRLISLICRRQMSRLVVTHKDRLLRFGSELLFDLCRAFGVKVVVTETVVTEDVNSRLVTDVIELMTVFSERLYGSRSRRNKTSTVAA